MAAKVMFFGATLGHLSGFDLRLLAKGESFLAAPAKEAADWAEHHPGYVAYKAVAVLLIREDGKAEDGDSYGPDSPLTQEVEHYLARLKQEPMLVEA